MKRKDFIWSMAALPLSATTLNMLANHHSDPSPLMPTLFVGHGSPMNAIEENEFVQGFRKVGQQLGKPKLILCISAHWETKGTMVTAMESPKTIHDFGGFPKALYDQQYPAPGSPELANKTKEVISSTPVELDHSWGLDHGAWTVLKHMYPDADVPVIQMSLNRNKTPEEHFSLAQELIDLRRQGVLVVGSGNMVHNLRLVDWRRLNDPFAFDWAKEANDRMKELIIANDIKPLLKYNSLGTAFQKAIPTPEHYLPLLYILALRQKNEELFWFNDKPLAGSLTMTSLLIK